MSNTFSLEDAKKAIADDGFYCIEDPTLGLRIFEMEQNGSLFLFSTMAGLEFCKSVLEDTCIITTVESSFERCRLGYYQRIAEPQPQVFQFMKGGINLEVLLVQLWGKGSRVVHYPGSHLKPFESVRASTGLWEIPFAALKRENIVGKPFIFENGGLVILDARLGLQMFGSPITCAFALEEVLVRQNWRKLVPPDSEDGAQMLAQLGSERIGVWSLQAPSRTLQD